MASSQIASETFRILALDGGGIKGTYTASVLAELERMTGESLSEYFDLVTGTSTGGIIAIALGLGIRPERIHDLYVNKGPTIFPSGRRLSWKRLFAAKHDRGGLQSALEEVFGSRLLGESANRLVIPAFDAQRGKVHLFKTNHAERYKQDHRLEATTVALSTTAAPTFFSAYETHEGSCYIDGGVWANCPALVGIVEAIGVLNVPLNCVHVLSIGTTSEPYFVEATRRKAGIARWAAHTAPLFSQAQLQATLGKCRVLLGDERFFRIDEEVTPGRFSLDNAKDVTELTALGISAARSAEDRVASRFLSRKVAVFEPHSPSVPPVLGASR